MSRYFLLIALAGLIGCGRDHGPAAAQDNSWMRQSAVGAMQLDQEGTAYFSKGRWNGPYRNNWSQFNLELVPNGEEDDGHMFLYSNQGVVLPGPGTYPIVRLEVQERTNPLAQPASEFGGWINGTWNGQKARYEPLEGEVTITGASEFEVQGQFRIKAVVSRLRDSLDELGPIEISDPANVITVTGTFRAMPDTRPVYQLPLPN